MLSVGVATEAGAPRSRAYQPADEFIVAAFVQVLADPVECERTSPLVLEFVLVAVDEEGLAPLPTLFEQRDLHTQSTVRFGS